MLTRRARSSGSSAAVAVEVAVEVAEDGVDCLWWKKHKGEETKEWTTEGTNKRIRRWKVRKERWEEEKRRLVTS